MSYAKIETSSAGKIRLKKDKNYKMMFSPKSPKTFVQLSTDIWKHKRSSKMDKTQSKRSLLYITEWIAKSLFHQTESHLAPLANSALKFGL